MEPKTKGLKRGRKKKLSAEDEKEILDRYFTMKAKQPQLAILYRVSYQTINNLINRYIRSVRPPAV